MTRTLPALRLEMERIFAADRRKVYGAWSDPEAVRRWMGPSDDLEVIVHRWDFRPGGSYRLEMRGGEGSPHIVGGRFVDLDEPSRLVFSWSWEDQPVMVTRVTVELAEVEGGTRLSLLHEVFPNQEARSGHEKGWLGTFDRLGRFLA